jgi:prepilin-type N-terminal cleavage/methylation domain-containing protein
MTPAGRCRGPRGFTLIELLLGIIIMAVVGIVLTRFMLGNSRLVAQQDAKEQARIISRAAQKLLTGDLRPVEVGNGVVAAAARDITVRSPYAFGVVCRANGTVTTVSLVPVDSLSYAAGGFSGFAWRDSLGAYRYVEGGTVLGAGTSATCLLDSVATLTGGQVITLAPGAPTNAVPGSPIFLYRQVRYEFKDSAIYPGRKALWRTLVATGSTDELAAPVDTSSHFNFYVLNGDTAQAAVPSPLTDIRGIEVALNGASVRTPSGTTTPRVSRVIMGLFFQNRLR